MFKSNKHPLNYQLVLELSIIIGHRTAGLNYCCWSAKIDTLEHLKEMRAGHKSYMAKMRANQKQVMANPESLTALMMANEEEM